MTTKKTTAKRAAKKTTAKEATGNTPNAAAKTTSKKPAAKRSTAKTGNKKISAIDAAAKALGEAKEPLTAKTMIERMATKDEWTSLGGQTPRFSPPSFGRSTRKGTSSGSKGPTAGTSHSTNSPTLGPGRRKRPTFATSVRLVVGYGSLVIVTLIGTKGVGRLCLCHPSPGYKLQQGDLANSPVLTAGERHLLLDAAWSLNEYVPEPTAAETDEKSLRCRRFDCNMNSNHFQHGRNRFHLGNVSLHWRVHERQGMKRTAA